MLELFIERPGEADGDGGGGEAEGGTITTNRKTFYISVGKSTVKQSRALNTFVSQGLRARGRRPWAMEVAWKKVGKN